MLAASAAPSVDICVHATGPYLEFARELSLSLDQFAFPESIVRMLVFTDRPNEVLWESNLLRIRVEAIEAPSRAWPEATLFRFADYAQHRELITADLAMFLDADMLAVDVFGPELTPRAWRNGVALVAHPGFFRARLSAQNKLRRLISRQPLQHALGSWEVNPASRAYVPASSRTNYVCGGTWFGLRSPAIDLCQQLAQRIRGDESDGVVAVWHDESHLNWWAAHNEVTVLTPEYCFVAGYENLSGLRPRVVALQKPPELVASIKGPTL